MQCLHTPSYWMMSCLYLGMAVAGVAGNDCTAPDDWRFTVWSADGSKSGTFNLCKFCEQPHDIAGADASGARYKVNICNRSTSLCAPEGINPSSGAVVQFFGQDTNQKVKKCTDPRTGEPVSCTAPCLPVARWPPASYELLEGQTAHRPDGYVAHFRPVAVSATGAFTPQCQPLSEHRSALSGDPRGGFPGVYRVSLQVECDDTAGTLQVINIQPLNTSRPCDLRILVVSRAGCPELELGAGKTCAANEQCRAMPPR
jgi:hypothetical protein